MVTGSLCKLVNLFWCSKPLLHVYNENPAKPGQQLCFDCFQLGYELKSKWHLLNSLFATFADLHVRKDATFAEVLHSYTHAYCSFILLNEAIPIVSGSHSAHALLISVLGSWIRFAGKKIQLVLKIFQLQNCTRIPVCSQIMWHTGIYTWQTKS